ncbi:MAG: hypothetical protein ACOVRJ_00485 [Roseateles sp.]
MSSTQPRLVVHNQLAPGRHRFALVVVDEHGRASAPDICVVTVRPKSERSQRPVKASNP